MKAMLKPEHRLKAGGSIELRTRATETMFIMVTQMAGLKLAGDSGISVANEELYTKGNQ